MQCTLLLSDAISVQAAQKTDLQAACKVKLPELPFPAILPLPGVYKEFVKLYKECMLRNFKSNKHAAETYTSVSRLQQKVQDWKDKMCKEDDADMIELIQKKVETALGEYMDQMGVFQREDVWEVHTMFNEFCSSAGCSGFEFEDLQQPCSASLE